MTGKDTALFARITQEKRRRAGKFLSVEYQWNDSAIFIQMDFQRGYTVWAEVIDGTTPTISFC